MSLPQPDSDALAYSTALTRRIADEIAAAGGWISFARYMELALYAPGMGYYSGGAHRTQRKARPATNARSVASALRVHGNLTSSPQ